MDTGRERVRREYSEVRADWGAVEVPGIFDFCICPDVFVARTQIYVKYLCMHGVNIYQITFTYLRCLCQQSSNYSDMD